jgi:hypothetical protein
MTDGGLQNIGQGILHRDVKISETRFRPHIILPHVDQRFSQTFIHRTCTSVGGSQECELRDCPLFTGGPFIHSFIFLFLALEHRAAALRRADPPSKESYRLS